ncbi:transglutaminase family protein [Thalassotalea sp. PLHSN55]|uniref:transglutaminase family protein n=1 Tax=Thalassotalea sp. PLHSN55 TaxID=3435888 RepID=UPI003F8563A4
MTAQMQWLLIAVVSANILTLIEQLAWWLIALTLLAVLWRSWLIPKADIVVNKWLLVAFALTGCVVLALNAKSLGLLLTMVHLLSFSYALKILEIKQRSDFYQLFFIGLFLLSASFIFTQELGYFALYSLVLILNITLLLSYFSSVQSVKSSYLLSAKLVLQSMPLAVALFFIFPKLSPFWQVPLAKSAQTGLSDSVTVGDVANLALSDKRAFRVTFASEAPPYQQLYWRTLALDQFDGKSWRQSQSVKDFVRKNNKKYPSVTHQVAGEGSQYQVIADASFQHWLFALDIATTRNSNIISLSDFSLYSKEPVTQLFSYRVTSYMDSPLAQNLSEQALRPYLHLPQNSNPQLQQLGRELRQLHQSPQAIINAVLQRFRVQEYFYTLSPPLLGEHALDEFYFQSLSGFCEHYASSFAFLMRAAGIPTRLVVGYLGGEYNQQGNFYTIKQQDAHAWTEVWLEGKGWQRIDPTAAVSPERVEQGFSDALFAQRSALSGELINFYQLNSIQWINAIKTQLESLDYQWTKWIVGYNTEQQVNLLKQWFGKVYALKGALAIAFALIVTMTLLMLVHRHHKAPKVKHIWLSYYLTLVKTLAAKGVVKHKSATVQQFAREVERKIPALSVEFHRFCQSFKSLEYDSITVEQQKKLTLLIKQQYQQCMLLLRQQKPLE